jgi:hypothetical protein
VYHMELGLCCGLQRIAHLVDGSSSHPHDALSERDPLPRSAMPEHAEYPVQCGANGTEPDEKCGQNGGSARFGLLEDQSRNVSGGSGRRVPGGACQTAMCGAAAPVMRMVRAAT